MVSVAGRTGWKMNANKLLNYILIHFMRACERMYFFFTKSIIIIVPRHI